MRLRSFYLLPRSVICLALAECAGLGLLLLLFLINLLSGKFLQI